MTNSENNKNAFLKNIGAVSRTKNGWQNYPTGSPNKDQRNGKTMKMKAKKIQATPPPPYRYYPTHAPKEMVIKNIANEISVLNYKGHPLPEDKQQRACSIYFRGDNNRRLIAGFLILQTLKDLGTTQKQMKEKFTYMSKGLISNVFKESIIAEWFYKEQSQVSQNLFIYYASPMMINGAYDYFNTIESSRNELLFKE